MAAAWGKKAIGKIDRSQFENDELLKSLGNQLNVDFSKYDQWQRKERVMRPPAPKKKAPQDSVTFKVGTRATSADSTPAPVPRGRRAQARYEEERRRQKEAVDMLEMRLRHAKQASEMYRKRAKELVEMNLDIAKDIDSEEHEVHIGVKRLLRKYEKFRGGIAALNTNFIKELSEVQAELEETKESIRIKLAALNKELEEMDGRLKAKQEELNVLHSYKDKEYPVKAMMISNLHAELESVKNSNQEDQEELEHIINTELSKYDKERIQLSNEITKRVTE
ncbi:GTP-binding protein rem 1, partial [Plakobranchus ocellatus]